MSAHNREREHKRARPAGVIEAEQLTADQTITTEYCIIGSGVGGSVAACTLSEAGRDVVILEAGPYRDAAVINTAPALVVSGVAEGFVEAVELAGRTIDSGAAGELLDRVVARSRSLRALETG